MARLSSECATATALAVVALGGALRVCCAKRFAAAPANPRKTNMVVDRRIGNLGESADKAAAGGGDEWLVHKLCRGSIMRQNAVA
jgi:hypothetical protein